MKFTSVRKIALIVSLVSTVTFCKKPEPVADVPELVTRPPSSVTATAATVGGYVSSDGGSVVTERGICCSKGHNPLVSDLKVSESPGTGDYQCIIPGLDQNTKYYARAYAVNKAGTGYGNEVEFTTGTDGGVINNTVTDIDGNVYKTIKIGTQTWMAENLRVTHYRNGSQIDEVDDSAAWVSFTKGAYCWFSNDSLTYKNTTGALYNWYAVTDSRRLCPAGWHIPSDAGWRTLTTVLGGDSVAGTLMKSDSGWFDNGNGSNASGFNALPGGARSNSGRFLGLGEFAPWWSSSEFDESYAWLRSLFHFNGKVDRSPYNKHDGLSVRCVKD